MITVVTGASRGAGKGIAIALGACGATVYVTGRSVSATDNPEFGGTIHDTAELVNRAGGTGIAVAVDHADDRAVTALFERITLEHGKLDILVNNAAKVGVPTSPGGFWQAPLESCDLINVGLRSHYVTSYHAAPLLIANGHGLMVSTGHHGAVCYFHSPAYGAQKAGADKMVADMAKELRPHNVAAVSIWMNTLDTERARAFFKTLPEAMQPKEKLESPQFIGRLIAALYASPRMMEFSGRALIGAELGALLNVTDIDGGRPVSHRLSMGGPPELHRSLI
jgi:NAD(P)-dependent dehydrogenase (short-subunit alcohol dehydrogenase family)